MLKQILWELRRHRRTAPAAAIAYALVGAGSVVLSRYLREPVLEYLHGGQLAWMLVGVPLFSFWIGAEHGGRLREPLAREGEGVLPMSSERRVAAAVFSALICAVGLFLLSVSTAMILSPETRSVAMKIVVETDRGSLPIEFSRTGIAIFPLGLAVGTFVAFGAAYHFKNVLLGFVMGWVAAAFSLANLFAGGALSSFETLRTPFMGPVLALLPLLFGASFFSLRQSAKGIERQKGFSVFLAAGLFVTWLSGPILARASYSWFKSDLSKTRRLVSTQSIAWSAERGNLEIKKFPSGFLAENPLGAVWWIEENGRRTKLIEKTSDAFGAIAFFGTGSRIIDASFDRDGKLWVLRRLFDAEEAVAELWAGFPSKPLVFQGTLPPLTFSELVFELDEGRLVLMGKRSSFDEEKKTFKRVFNKIDIHRLSKDPNARWEEARNAKGFSWETMLTWNVEQNKVSFLRGEDRLEGKSLSLDGVFQEIRNESPRGFEIASMEVIGIDDGLIRLSFCFRKNEEGEYSVGRYVRVVASFRAEEGSLENLRILPPTTIRHVGGFGLVDPETGETSSYTKVGQETGENFPGASDEAVVSFSKGGVTYNTGRELRFFGWDGSEKSLGPA